jgi:hypothetical protein
VLSLANTVKLDRAGFAYVRLCVKPNKKTAMSCKDFKVDTGANRTTINKKWLFEMGYDDNWIKKGKRLEGHARPTLASGLPLEDCYEVTLPEINLGDWVGYNWPVLTSLSVPFKFLLGTDSMQFFDWYISHSRNECSFEFIPDKRRVLFNGKEQSIHALDEMD